MITKIGKALAVVAALALLAMPARALAHEKGKFHRGRGHDQGRHLGWYKHHNDNDADDHPNPYFEGYRYDRYGDQSNYRYGNPSNYNYNYGNYGNAGQWQRNQALVNQDRLARAQYQAAFARGDKKAQKHYLELLRATDKQLGMTKQQIGAGVLPYANGYQANRGIGNGMVPWMQMMGF